MVQNWRSFKLKFDWQNFYSLFYNFVIFFWGGGGGGELFLLTPQVDRTLHDKEAHNTLKHYAYTKPKTACAVKYMSSGRLRNTQIMPIHSNKSHDFYSLWIHTL